MAEVTSTLHYAPMRPDSSAAALVSQPRAVCKAETDLLFKLWDQGQARLSGELGATCAIAAGLDLGAPAGRRAIDVLGSATDHRSSTRRGLS